MKKILVISIYLCFILNYSQAQELPISMGISLGLNYQKPIITESNWKNQGLDELISMQTKGGYGFQLGITGFYQLSENFGIRMNPSLDFSESSIQFQEVFDKSTQFTIENINIQIPIRFEWEAAAWKFSPTIAMGGAYFRNLVYTEKKTPFALKLDDIAAQVAIGCKIKSQYFNILPQLIYSNGFKNLEQLNNNIYTQAIHSWNNQTLTFQLIFEK